MAPGGSSWPSVDQPVGQQLRCRGHARERVAQQQDDQRAERQARQADQPAAGRPGQPDRRDPERDRRRRWPSSCRPGRRASPAGRRRSPGRRRRRCRASPGSRRARRAPAAPRARRRGSRRGRSGSEPELKTSPRGSSAGSATTSVVGQRGLLGVRRGHLDRRPAASAGRRPGCRPRPSATRSPAGSMTKARRPRGRSIAVTASARCRGGLDVQRVLAERRPSPASKPATASAGPTAATGRSSGAISLAGQAKAVTIRASRAVTPSTRAATWGRDGAV